MDSVIMNELIAANTADWIINLCVAIFALIICAVSIAGILCHWYRDDVFGWGALVVVSALVLVGCGTAFIVETTCFQSDVEYQYNHGRNHRECTCHKCQEMCGFYYSLVKK